MTLPPRAARPAPPGFVVWRIVGTQGCTVLPALVPTPPSIRRGYQAQVISNLTGVCPLSQQTAWIEADALTPSTPRDRCPRSRTLRDTHQRSRGAGARGDGTGLPASRPLQPSSRPGRYNGWPYDLFHQVRDDAIELVDVQRYVSFAGTPVQPRAGNVRRQPFAVAVRHHAIFVTLPD